MLLAHDPRLGDEGDPTRVLCGLLRAACMVRRQGYASTPANGRSKRVLT